MNYAITDCLAVVHGHNHSRQLCKQGRTCRYTHQRDNNPETICLLVVVCDFRRQCEAGATLVQHVLHKQDQVKITILFTLLPYYDTTTLYNHIPQLAMEQLRVGPCIDDSVSSCQYFRF